MADKISSLITTTPANFDSDEDAEDTKAKVVDRCDDSDRSEDNVQYSKIRTQNVDTLDLLDKRYAGKKVSRKDVYNSDDDASDDLGSEDSEEEEEADADSEEEDADPEDVEDADSDDVKDSDAELTDGEAELDSDENDSINEESSDGERSERQAGDSEDESYSDDDGYDVDIGNPLYRDRSAAPTIKTMSETNLKADIGKGNCVRSQLKVWESLLEMRIKLQKCLVTSNQLPQYDVHDDYKADPEFAKVSNETKSKLTTVLNNMLNLQSSLLKRYPETKNLSLEGRKRKASEPPDDPMDEEIPSDTEDKAENPESPSKEPEESVPLKRLKLSSLAERLEESHKLYEGYRNSVVQKWNEKTRLATGNFKKGMNQSTLKQIEFALSDKDKLRKKTQLKRSEYSIVGKTGTEEENDDGRRTQEYDSEIYDDDDFYHQLLRDLIEYKSSGITDPIQLSKQWIQLQNMRRKMKRKIDTRATKGRRIRYDVHNKLVNFMAPITVNDAWTDTAKNELYNSLFGKIKPVDGEPSR